MAFPSTNSLRRGIQVCAPDKMTSDIVFYTYEIWTTKDANIESELISLDWRIQQVLSSELEDQYGGGKYDGICDVGPQDAQENRHVVDDAVETCSETYVFPSYIKSCAMDLEQCELTCTPIKGFALVTYEPDIVSQDMVEQTIRIVLNEIMLGDRLLEEGGVVKKVMFSNRSEPSTDTTVAKAEAAPEHPSKQQDSGLLLAGGVASVVLCFFALIAIIAVFVRRRIRMQKRGIVKSEEVEGTLQNAKSSTEEVLKMEKASLNAGQNFKAGDNEDSSNSFVSIITDHFEHDPEHMNKKLSAVLADGNDDKSHSTQATGEDDLETRSEKVVASEDKIDSDWGQFEPTHSADENEDVPDGVQSPDEDGSEIFCEEDIVSEDIGGFEVSFKA